MWRVAGRVVGVFVTWGVLLAVALGMGMSPHGAEVLAVCSAGLSLILWGAAIERQQRRFANIAAEETEPTDRRERASV